MFSSLFKKDRLLYRGGLGLGFSYIQWVGSTARWWIEGEEHYLLERAKGGSIIFAFWHNQLMLMPFCYAGLTRRQKVSVLISQSKDGQIVSDFIERFGFSPIRGSSSRGGTGALLQLSGKLKSGFDLAITPDGPRGPKLQAQFGVVALASLSGCSIIPTAYDVRWKKVFGSWDGFKVPFPYNRAALVIGSPICVGALATEEHLQNKLKEVQAGLDAVNERAEKIVTSHS